MVNDSASFRLEHAVASGDHREEYLHVLREIVSLPTAPFHEERVAARIGAYLRSWGIPFTVDRYGNLLAHYVSGNPQARPLVLMAHMDHPAFTVTERGGPNAAHLTAQLEGGVAAQCFKRRVGVRVFPRGTDSTGLYGHVAGYEQGAGPRDVRLYLALDDPEAAHAIEPGDFGIWDLPNFERRDGLIHARAIDDLAGCAAILLALWELSREGAATDVYGVFTRAEEVGLVGARLLLQAGTLPPGSYIVSLEASKELPDAVQGGGPVIRVGDRGATFSEEAEQVLKAAAERLGSAVWHAGPPSTVGVQRQLMSGGRCEANIAVMLGYAATGLAFPLGNYHNVGADRRIVPENIHEQDFLTGVALLHEAGRVLPALDRIRADHLAGYQQSEQMTTRLQSTMETIRAAATGEQ